MARLPGYIGRVAVLILTLVVAARLAGAQEGANPEQARHNLDTLMDALTKMHPRSTELADRTAKLKERLSTLTPDQLATAAPLLSGPEFTAAVDRLANEAVQSAQATLFTPQAPLPGAQYDSCGSTRSDTDSGRDLVIAENSLTIAAIVGDVACNSIVVIVGEGSNLPACIIAGVLHEAAQATQFELDLRSYCDDVINGNEIRGILNNTTVIGSNLAYHDTDVKAALAKHDEDIKALLATLQKGVDEANQRLKVSEALERQGIKLLLTPDGRRAVDPAVMTCTGDNCPKLVECPGDECSFPLKK